jgi:hypothetical protein
MNIAYAYSIQDVSQHVAIATPGFPIPARRDAGLRTCSTDGVHDGFRIVAFDGNHHVRAQMLDQFVCTQNIGMQRKAPINRRLLVDIRPGPHWLSGKTVSIHAIPRRAVTFKSSCPSCAEGTI